MPDIVIVGSLNMDLLIGSPHLPLPGETVIGGDLQTLPGGKGANQAVAAGRLGGSVAMIGRVGADDFGTALRRAWPETPEESWTARLPQVLATGHSASITSPR